MPLGLCETDPELASAISESLRIRDEEDAGRLLQWSPLTQAECDEVLQLVRYGSQLSAEEKTLAELTVAVSADLYDQPGRQLREILLPPVAVRLVEGAGR